MKLLFDANLSHKLIDALQDVFPDSAHVRMVRLKERSDLDIWGFAKRGGFTIVTLDSDFYDLTCYFGQPPKVIWLRCGNQPTHVHEGILRAHLRTIGLFDVDPEAGCVELA